ncbi:sulfatase [Aestuariivivens sediminicola]|uniref:sulfatase n=1 Tax=Aestuariivivens sediminicola TaxID=2913560 RepID=UPI001F597809|nr:sulfatase [Aestuariivivens sediminicola]
MKAFCINLQGHYVFPIGIVMAVLFFSCAQEPVVPNILFIATDDLNTDLGCYGNSQVITPNIDKLAQMGVRFDNAYCQFPLCGPSRASIMTGLRPNTTKFLGNRDSIRKLKPDVETMGQFFQKKGYYVGRVGKIYHYNNPSAIGTDGHDDTLSWHERFNPKGIDKIHEDRIIRFPGGTTGRKGGLGISMAYWDPVSEDSEHTDGMVADRAVEMIERNKDQPFFIAAGFFNPHCPYVAPKKYFDLYPLEDIAMPSLDEAKEDLEDVPAMAMTRHGRLRWPYYFDGITMDEARRCKQAYYASVSFIDAQVGKLIAALENNNLLENTIIVFWSDHGYFLGEKGLWYKAKNFERSVKVPLIISGYGVDQKNKVIKDPVELIDLFPTLVQGSGNTINKELEGSSLIPFLKNTSYTWDKPAVSQVFYPDRQGYSIRTGRWRYTEWMGGEAGRELYDHENDPEEITNLANHPEYQYIVNDLSAQLEPYSIYY